MADIDLSRRAVLSCVPMTVLAATAVLSTNIEVDPVYAVIERHRAAFALFIKTSETFYDEKREEEAHDRACSIEHEARRSLINTVPTTIAGACAVIEWLVQYDEGCVPDTCGAWLKTFAKSDLFTSLRSQGGVHV